MPPRQTKPDPSDEVVRMLKQYFEIHGGVLFDSEEAEALRSLARRLNAMPPEQRQHVNDLLEQSGKLGRLLRAYETIVAVGSAGVFVRNVVLIATPLVLLWISANGWLSKLLRMVEGTK